MVINAPNGNENVLNSDILIKPLKSEDEACVVDLIRRNLQNYEEAGSVIAATFRRIENLLELYSVEGAVYFVARNVGAEGQCVGGAGLGPLHGLPPSEGLGEIRDLVVEESFRGRGLGTRLLKRCIEEARNFGYKRLYLETTPQMQIAQKLFIRFGFRPVTQAQTTDSEPVKDRLPCYYLLEELSDKGS